MQTHELIKRYYASFNDGDMETFLSLLDENVAHDLNQGERQIGKTQFTHFMQRMNHSYKENIKELVIMVSSDNQHAAAEYVVEGTYLATDTGLPPANNQKYALAGGAFFTIKNDKITRITNYYNMNEIAMITAELLPEQLTAIRNNGKVHLFNDAKRCGDLLSEPARVVKL